MNNDDKKLLINEAFLLKLIEQKVTTRKEYFREQRFFAKNNKISFFHKDELVRSYQKLVDNGNIQPNKNIEELLKIKSIRSSSGIVVVSVLTKPYDCPGNCIYCPNEKDVPKSYLSNEPAVMRAIACQYDPYKQTKLRLKALYNTGHPIDKINIRVIGGTWSFYPANYQTWFIKRIFQACNEFSSKEKTKFNLESLQEANQIAKNRIVEISIETRQDYINKKEIFRLRKLGVTKVELGVQSIYDRVLQLNNRGNKDIETINASKLLRDAGFKVSYQIMLNLPGSNIESDIRMFHELFHNSSYCPDHLKIYPLALVKNAPIYELFCNKKFKPYNKEQLTHCLVEIKKEIPYYCRIERVIRDIPADNIVEGGAKISNLRQIVLDELIKQGDNCRCIRCREYGSAVFKQKKYSLFRQDYEAADGKEIFLSFASKDQSELVSFLRLRIPSQYLSGKKHFIASLNDSAIIREIHTYGTQLPVGDKDSSSSQHQGLGKKLIFEAEKIARDEFKLKRISVIAGVGVREYFFKQGYSQKETYMTKDFKN